MKTVMLLISAICTVGAARLVVMITEREKSDDSLASTIGVLLCHLLIVILGVAWIVGLIGSL